MRICEEKALLDSRLLATESEGSAGRNQDREPNYGYLTKLQLISLCHFEKELVMPEFFHVNMQTIAQIVQ